MSLGAEGVLHLAVDMSANSHVSRVHAAQTLDFFLFNYLPCLACTEFAAHVYGLVTYTRGNTYRGGLHTHTHARGVASAPLVCPRANTRYTNVLSRSLVLSSPLGLPARRGHLESRKLKARRDGAPDQRPVPQGARVLPLPALDDGLRALAVPEVGPKNHVADGRAVVPRQREPKRRAGVVVPRLDGVEHAVPVRRPCLALEQVVDVGAGRAALGRRLGVPERLDVVALFGMGSQVERRDDVLRRLARCHVD